jgi:uncharacterized lipoprotein YehR (DUF1307 family)
MNRLNFLKSAAITVSTVFVLSSCGDKEEPKPPVSLETISITAPVVTEVNRTVTDKVGEFSYADKADAVVKMTFKNAEPATITIS